MGGPGGPPPGNKYRICPKIWPEGPSWGVWGCTTPKVSLYTRALYTLLLAFSHFHARYPMHMHIFYMIFTFHKRICTILLCIHDIVTNSLQDMHLVGNSIQICTSIGKSTRYAQNNTNMRVKTHIWAQSYTFVHNSTLTCILLQICTDMHRSLLKSQSNY